MNPQQVYRTMDRRQLEPGTKLGSYVIDRQLTARGSRGLYVVREGSEQPLMLTAVEARDTVRVAELQAEFKTLSRLRQPSLIKTQRWAEESGYAFYVSKYVQGVPLHSLVLTGRLMLPGVMAIYGRVIEAVAYLHASGITHGDLAPDNILVCRRGRLTVPVLVGFGIARVTSRAAFESGELAGALHFVSPEHAKFLLGNAPGRTYESGPLDDVYTMGINLYFLLTGEWPVPRTSDTRQGRLEFLRRVVDHPPADPLKLNPYAPIRLAELAMRMLEHNPESRPANAGVAHREFLSARALDRDDMDSMAMLLEYAESTSQVSVEPRTDVRARSPFDLQAEVPARFRMGWMERAVWVAALLAAATLGRW
jgi:eukaryotic-like serine/threonine-protein kinase